LKHSITALVLFTSASVQADEWTGKDKQLHLIGGAAIAAAVTAGTGNELHGFLSGTASGLLKEVYDSTGRGQVSGKDFAVTALGALLGAKATGWAIGPNRITYSINLNIF
jgi:uncharacterized protein YfiM (DUF2279 family)